MLINKMSVTHNYTGKCHNCDRAIGVFVEVYFKRNEGIHNEQWCLDCVANKGKIDQNENRTLVCSNLQKWNF